MIRLARLIDIGKVVQIFRETYNEEELKGIYPYLSFKIKNPEEYFILLDSSDSICLIVERIGNFKCQFHIYSTPEHRGKSILSFSKKAATWIFENTLYTSFLTFSKNRPSSLMARKIGMEEVGLIRDAGGEGQGELLFQGDREMIKNKLNIEEEV